MLHRTTFQPHHFSCIDRHIKLNWFILRVCIPIGMKEKLIFSKSDCYQLNYIAIEDGEHGYC